MDVVGAGTVVLVLELKFQVIINLMPLMISNLSRKTKHCQDTT
jgi:hypothetical protein